MSKKFSFLTTQYYSFFLHVGKTHTETHRCLNQKDPFGECGLPLRATEAMPLISAIPVSSSAHG